MDQRMFLVSYNGRSLTVIGDEVMATVGRMVTEAPGCGVPSVVECSPAVAPAPVAPVAPAPAPVAVAVPPAAPSPVPYTAPDAKRGAGEIDQRGLARSEADRAAALASGFAPQATVFARGSRVIDAGVENARRARIEYEAKPLVNEACEALIGKIRAEDREDRDVAKHEVMMTRSGLLALPNGERIAIDRDTFATLASRCDLPAGAGPYLSECDAELRAINFNRWQKKHAESKRNPGDEIVRLRTREGRAGREAFAVVSQKYTAFDADKICEAIRLAMPNEARCDITYDGARLRANVLFQTTIAPQDFVAGEFFRCGVVVTSDDTGGGSVKIDAVLEQNLCLNLIIIQRDAQPVLRARHLGNPHKLAREIRQALAKSQGMIAPFIERWGYARRQNLTDVLETAIDTTTPARVIFERTARGILERELVTVSGRKDDVIPALWSAYQRDTSSDGPRGGRLTKAGLINTFTRYAHESAEGEEALEIERGASALVWSSRPLPVATE